MSVGIVIPTVAALCLRECLRRVWKHTDEVDEIVIVCDLPDTDRLRLLCDAMINLRASVIINHTRVGVPKAFNQGIRVLTTDYVVLMNDDVFVEPGWLPPLIEAVELKTDMGIATSMITSLPPVTPTGPPAPAAIGECSLISREVLEKVGLFNEDQEFFKIGLDWDYFPRVWEQGYRPTSITDSIVHHITGQTIQGQVSVDDWHQLGAKVRALHGERMVSELLPPEYPFTSLDELDDGRH